MSVTNNAVYLKAGANFGSGGDAWADKNSLYTPELKASIEACYTQMLADGVLLEPVYATWDQDTFHLTIVKVVSSVAAYNAAVTFNVSEVVADATAAGWTYVGSSTI